MFFLFLHTMEAVNRSVLVLDIETVSAYTSYEHLSETEQKLWIEKHEYLGDELQPAELYARRAAVEAEFGQLICLGMGFLRIREDTAESIHIRVLNHSEEHQLLAAFLEALPSSGRYFIAAHNAREFDLPFLCRRMLAHQMDLPPPFQLQNKKPWELQHIQDTFELWRFGDRKNYTSLPLLCYTLQIECDEILYRISGKDIHHLYYEKKDMNTIQKYVAAQVSAIAQVYLRLQGKELLSAHQIEYASKTQNETN